VGEGTREEFVSAGKIEVAENVEKIMKECDIRSKSK